MLLSPMKNLLSRFKRSEPNADGIGEAQHPVPLNVRIEYMLSESVPFNPDHYQIPAIRNAVEVQQVRLVALRTQGTDKT